MADDMALRLAVIIPTYNYERYVGRAIESVTRQIDPRVELIVVDDGSTDGSWAIIQAYGIAKSFLVENGGAARACLQGFAQTTAPFVLFLDADDELIDGALARILENLDDRVAKLQFPLLPINENGTVIGDPLPPLRDFRDRATLMRDVAVNGVYSSPPTSGNVFHRSLCALIEEVDYETWVDGVTLIAAPFFGDVVSLSTPLGRYRIHGANFSGSGAALTSKRFQAEADRFVSRLDHLKRTLVAKGEARALLEPDQSFYYRETRTYQSVFEARRPQIGHVLVTLACLARSTGSPSAKAAKALIIGLCMILPNLASRRVVEYRFRAGRRSFVGLMRSLFPATS
ncbi:glycosyltransferase family 2 protein [Lichenihabitans psoromatis]|uniref:glycosyltransferase family 2 protein n=1 Tax=Lichenihabitans psoromatis TaxID=2528642 RepID=UPI001038348D|nr:glycosyltransferase [Lichenihabitans psoromatis]